MKYDSQIKDQVLIFNLEGDLIGENSGLDLIEKVNEAQLDGVKYSIINIEGVRYINSAGIGVLITILTKFRNKGGEIVLLSPSESVKKLLIITKLNAIFHVSSSMDEAVKSLRNNG